MQQIFYTTATPEEYSFKGKDFPFPQPAYCLHPDCLKKVPPKKHGFYSRNAIDIDFDGRIAIRRYYCKYCKRTISYLPSFCLPYFQYALEIIFIALVYLFDLEYSLDKCLGLVRAMACNLHWDRSHLQFYAARFISNLNRIKVGLRQLLPGVRLPKGESAKKEGAKNALRTITGFTKIQAFSSKYFFECGYSFMAPCKIS